MVTRRNFLKAALLGSTAVLAVPAFNLVSGAADRPASFSARLAIPALLGGTMRDGVRVFDLRAQRGVHEFFKGVQTDTLGINGNFLGPTMRLRIGERVRFNVTNNIGEPTTMHWHGIHIPARFDGGPHQIIADGDTWSPEFEVKQLPATCWYHSHMFHKTGEQVWKGLAGVMILEDEVSDALELPRDYGVDDIPLVLQDRIFNRDGSLSYNPSMHNIMMGMKGDTAMVNGTIAPYFEARTGKIRLRLLNGSNARFFNLGFDDEREFHQIATDGSFLEKPLKTRRVRLGPGERAEIIVDVSGAKPFILRSYPFAGSGGVMGTVRRGFGMMRNMMGGGMMGDDNRRFDFLQIRPAKSLASSPELPAKLVDLPQLEEASAVRTRKFVMEMRMGPAMMMGGGAPMSINGKAMDIKRVDEVVKLGDTEIWEISNASPQPHPFHIHDIQFLILDRDGKPPLAGERGFKDTVIVDHNETVRVIARFEDYADPDNPYMYHCHILEHEDAGMMGQFIVTS